MSQVGSFGVGQVGRFERTLPPRTRVQYDSGYELGLEVLRWFHYRHNEEIGSAPVIKNVSMLEDLLLNIYKNRVYRNKLKYWDVLEDQARAFIREFKDTFSDVLAEMEFIR